MERGVGRCGNEDGPLHDLPDWYFADGTAAPSTPKQRKWAKKRLTVQERKDRLIKEMEEDIAKGNIRQFF